MLVVAELRVLDPPIEVATIEHHVDHVAALVTGADGAEVRHRLDAAGAVVAGGPGEALDAAAAAVVLVAVDIGLADEVTGAVGRALSTGVGGQATHAAVTGPGRVWSTRAGVATGPAGIDARQVRLAAGGPRAVIEARQAARPALAGTRAGRRRVWGFATGHRVAVAEVLCTGDHRGAVTDRVARRTGALTGSVHALEGTSLGNLPDAAGT